MPAIMTKVALFKKYKVYHAEYETDEPLIAKTTFVHMFKTKFKHVKFPKYTVLGNCSDCIMMKDTLAKKAMTTAERNQLKSVLTEHQLLADQEKDMYNSHRVTAGTRPDLSMSIILDGASPYGLPLQVPAPSAWKKLERYTLHAHGIINHGQQIRELWLHQGQYGYGANFAISILHNHLIKAFARTTDRPPILYLQLDNCWRENKNQYMLGYCHWLIEMHCFEEIYMSFLPVGHTHEDVDQMFSVVRTGIRGCPQVYSVEDFVAKIPEWFTKQRTRPTCHYYTNAWDWKTWLTPFLAQNISGQSKPHVFHFIRTPNLPTSIIMETKEYHSRGNYHGPYQVHLTIHC